MATLSAVQLEDLPVVVKFILHSISTSDAFEVRDNPYFVRHVFCLVMYFLIILR